MFEPVDGCSGREGERDGGSTRPREPHDAKPEEVKPVIDVGDARLLGRERQPKLVSQQRGRRLLDGLGLGLGAVHQPTKSSAERITR
jgi:hypothetical protein